ncbi:hypothetical protein RFI_27080 [Reticulomyxa filosa]|uniref:Uncharacterized protein n=1 Tax=Reticulomyxa filosa TaxID=46433 RepID=X6M8I0_RETFI|nr:hypothetical protein RFI_27080 [Reticulomyxa filosa]|eukprot:ETO10298.1 hypothetical protein RFI_27080 [Reticulomyxa filosa]
MELDPLQPRANGQDQLPVQEGTQDIVDPWCFNHRLHDTVLRLAVVNWVFSSRRIMGNMKLHGCLSECIFGESIGLEKLAKTNNLKHVWRRLDYESEEEEEGQEIIHSIAPWHKLTFAHLRHFSGNDVQVTFCGILKEFYIWPFYRVLQTFFCLVVTLYLIGRVFNFVFPYICLVYYTIVLSNMFSIPPLLLISTLVNAVLILIFLVALLPYAFWWLIAHLSAYFYTYLFNLGYTHTHTKWLSGDDVYIFDYMQIKERAPLAHMKHIYEAIVNQPIKEQILRQFLGADIASVICLYLTKDFDSRLIEWYQDQFVFQLNFPREWCVGELFFMSSFDYKKKNKSKFFTLQSEANNKQKQAAMLDYVIDNYIFNNRQFNFFANDTMYQWPKISVIVQLFSSEKLYISFSRRIIVLLIMCAFKRCTIYWKLYFLLKQSFYCNISYIYQKYEHLFCDYHSITCQDLFLIISFVESQLLIVQTFTITYLFLIEYQYCRHSAIIFTNQYKSKINLSFAKENSLAARKRKGVSISREKNLIIFGSGQRRLE